MANIRSLDELGSGGGSESEDHDDVNDYYAGGEKSGQLIRGQPNEKKDGDDGDRVGSLFESARRHGAQEGRAEDLAAARGSGGGGGGRPSLAFQGTARTLAGGPSSADAAGPSNAAAPAAANPAATPAAAAQDDAPAPPRTHVITFYRAGVFTVDEGPPRRVDDPANADFVDSIGRGECPSELDPGPGGAPVTVNLLRRDAEYSEPPKPKYVAFAGSGQTLAGGGGGAGGEGASSSATAVQGAAAAAAAASGDGGGEWAGVDESAPTTSLQLRMADGSRLVARFNTTHTVADVRRFVRASRPDLAHQPYAFASGGFPPQPVTEEGKSLEALGLLNAVLVQRRA